MRSSIKTLEEHGVSLAAMSCIIACNLTFLLPCWMLVRIMNCGNTSEPTFDVAHSFILELSPRPFGGSFGFGVAQVDCCARGWSVGLLRPRQTRNGGCPAINFLEHFNYCPTTHR
ncbi:hypothetical protein BDV19DRAFT_372070 [Aspergillus venezuelensis]